MDRNPGDAHRATWTWQRLGPAFVLTLAFCVRASFVFTWHDPYGIHNSDEAFLPYEAVAMWEGVTPRELGWPASTVRLLLSTAYAVEMVAEKPSVFLSRGSGPVTVMEGIAQWSADRLDDPRILYVTGRWLLIVLGVLQVGLAYWAGARWNTRSGGLIAALLCAVAPIAVSHSQFVLADMMGVLCVTWLLGLLGSESPAGTGRALAAGVLVGLATASKFHFAIWLLPALGAVWQSTRRTSNNRTVSIRAAAWCLLASGGVVLLLVPWLWLNPVLMLKEFQGVVLSKVAAPEAMGISKAVQNIATAFTGLGWLAIAGTLPGLAFLGMRHGGRSIPVYLGLAIGTLAIALTGRLYGRYALLVLPPVALMSGIGLVELITRTKGSLRVIVSGAILIVMAFSGQQLWASQVYAGALDSYSRAYSWLMSHMKPGDRIAVDAEFPQFIPRTREQLHAMVAELSGPQAYVDKMASNGFRVTSQDEPMRLAVLNDEFYVAHWARRELSAKTSRGFNLTLYADAPQYNSILTKEAVAQFVQGLTDTRVGFDVLILNRPIQLPVMPDVVFAGNPGRTISVYVRRKDQPVQVGPSRPSLN